MYRWWPRHHPDEVAVTGPTALIASIVCVIPFGLVFLVPAVTRATGVSAVAAWTLILVHVGWSAVAALVLHPRRRAHAWAFHLSVVGNLMINTALATAFPVLGGDPRTPLWMAPLMYACFNGSARELEPSIGVLATHVVAPLTTIPIFFARGAPTGWSLAGPLLCAALSFVAYHFMAAVSAGWRVIARERDEALAALGERDRELERRQLAQDLHDSVGSALSLVGLYGDLVDQLAESPTELRRVSGTLREAAAEGLSELRGVLEAMAPRAGDLATLCHTLDTVGSRVTTLTQVPISVELRGPGDVAVPGPVRLAVVRVFQEALNNAVRHGAARRVDARLGHAEGHVTLEVVDDGRGFAPAALAGTGRGLAGMRERARALGGRFELEARPGAGAQLRMALPVGDRAAG
ncbi:MAG TPA: sensor histidine kinase [Polyangia bacterium]